MMHYISNGFLKQAAIAYLIVSISYPGRVLPYYIRYFALMQKNQKIKAVRNLPKTDTAHPLLVKLANRAGILHCTLLNY